MIRRPGGCATTAFGLSIGLSSDPTVSLRVELVQCWLEVARGTSVPLTAIARTWELLRGRLAGPRRRSRVCGQGGGHVCGLVFGRWPGFSHDWR